MGKNRASGLPVATSVRTGTMSVSSLLMAENPVTVPPSRSKLSAKAWAIDREYGSPSWMAAAETTPSPS